MSPLGYGVIYVTMFIVSLAVVGVVVANRHKKDAKAH